MGIPGKRVKHEKSDGNGIERVLYVVVAAGALGFFVGSVIENEMAYTLSGCIAVWAGLVIAIRGRKARPKAKKA